MKQIHSILMAVVILVVSSCTEEPSVPNIPVTGVTLSSKTLSMTVGEQSVLEETVSPSNATNKNVRFTSSKESVATVTPEGIVEAVAAGQAIVTVVTEDGNFKSSCVVSVAEKTIAVNGITLNETALSLYTSEVFKLVATVSPDNATSKRVSWKSSNEDIAYILPDGTVEALSIGEATITATSSSNTDIKATCNVTVYFKAPDVNTLEVSDITSESTKLNGDVRLYSVGSKLSLAFNVYPPDEDAFAVGYTKYEGKGMEYSWYSEVSNLKPGKKYEYCARVSIDGVSYYGERKSFTTLAPPEPEYIEPEYIDLGLPSGTKWATFNVGANAPDEYGDLFAWGETESKTKYSWDNYKYYTGSYFTKYCTNPQNGIVDNKAVLERSDDAASMVLGENWRIPTIEEWEELYANCYWSFSSYNGEWGFKLQSTMPGYTDNWIFLPFGHSVRWTQTRYYWSSTLDIDTNANAHCLELTEMYEGNSRERGTRRLETYPRGNGGYIRPVWNWKNNP